MANEVIVALTSAANFTKCKFLILLPILMGRHPILKIIDRIRLARLRNSIETNSFN